MSFLASRMVFVVISLKARDLGTVHTHSEGDAVSCVRVQRRLRGAKTEETRLKLVLGLDGLSVLSFGSAMVDEVADEHHRPA